MARRPKRTYNQATGQWEFEKLWDYRDDDGYYWKDGVQVDNSGRPIYDAQGNEQGAETPGSPEATSTPGTGVDGGPLPEMGDETIEWDDPRNLINVGSDIMPYVDAVTAGLVGRPDSNNQNQSFIAGSKPISQASSLRRVIEDRTKGASSTRKVAPSLLNRKANA